VTADGTGPIREPQQVNEAWLTEVLRASGRLSGTVRQFRIEPVGAGQMGVCVRYHLTYDGDATGAPSTLIGKFSSLDPATRGFMSQFGYANEVAFYQEIASTVTIRTPRCFHASIDAEGWFTLLLADVVGARAGDQLVGCSVAEVEAAVAELVGLHAPRWGDPTLRDVSVFTRPGLDPDSLQAILASVMAEFIDRYRSAWEPRHEQFYRRLAVGAAAWQRARPEPVTVTHADFRPDNLLFRSTGDDIEVTAVDWQGLQYGTGVADVGFLIGNALDPDARRTHETELVRGYHWALEAAGITNYDWDRCWDEYRRSLLAGLLTVVLGAAYGTRTERGDAMFELLSRRHADQILDLGADEFLEESR
jgi:hypothetical protein